MPIERLSFNAVRQTPCDRLLLLQYEDAGTRYAVGRRLPGLRSDIVKMTCVTVQGLKMELRLTEVQHGILTDGKRQFTVWSPTEKETESGSRIWEKYRQEE